MSKIKDKLKDVEWRKVGQTVGKFAPLLGSVLGGPAGGMAGSLIAAALGVENEPTAVSEAIKNDPDAAVKIRQLELDHKVELERIAFQVTEQELLDKQNARAVHSISKMPAIICIGITFMVGLGAYWLFTVPVPEENASTVYLLFGSLLTKWGDSVAYWVGTTRSSAEKDRRLLR